MKCIDYMSGVLRVERIRTKKYQRNTFISHVVSVETFNIKVQWNVLITVVSVESWKNKNKEISKKHIYFSCCDCRDFYLKITSNLCITCRECREWPVPLRFTMYILIQSLRITPSFELNLRITTSFELKLQITPNFELNLQITTTSN